MVDVLQQSGSLFDISRRSRRGILPLQVMPSEPGLPTLVKATGLLAVDESTNRRMAHLDPDLYDLRPESHLSRFCRALLGDAGTGQLRKHYTVTRLEAVLNSTHFFDLDGLYGSLFGAGRKADEFLPINPMSGVATPDEWDAIAVRDSNFRERIVALAKSLPMAGTLPGLQQAAEAITGADCDVYETWALLDFGNVASSGRTWDEIEALYPDFDGFEAARQTWDLVMNRIQIGRAGVDTRDEVIVRVKKRYEPTDNTSEAGHEALRKMEEDSFHLQRVLTVLKPAGVLLTVENLGESVTAPLPISSLDADSSFWEVVTKTVGKPSLSGTSPYPASVAGVASAPTVPPFSTLVGFEWTHNGSVSSVAGYALEATDVVTAEGPPVTVNNWETSPETSDLRAPVQYLPSNGVADQRALIGGQMLADSMVVAHPYAGPRKAVPADNGS